MIAGLLAEKRSSTSESLKIVSDRLISMFGGAPTTSGVSVTEEKALGLSSVWACVSIIARTMASFPLPVYKELPTGGKERAKTNPVYKLLHDTPNSEQTAYEWRSLTSLHQNLWGAGISEIEFDRRGNPVALWPIPPWYVEPTRTQTRELIYKVNLKNGGTKILYPWQVVVFQSMTTSRDKWMSPIRVHRETVGAALAVREYGAKTFGQGINPAGVLSGVNFGAEVSAKSLREKYGGYEGLGAAHRLMFVEEGMKFEKIGVPPEDAQYLQTRQFDISEIARIYHVPLFMLQEHTKSTSWGSGLEEQKNGFVTFTMRPICVQWEQEFNKKLLADPFKTEFLVDGLLRGNIKDRFEAYTKAFAMGVYSIDEIREMENRNALEGGIGQNRFIPLNLGTLENVIKSTDDMTDGTTDDTIDDMTDGTTDDTMEDNII